MSVSDLIVVITLVIAILALISERNRTYIFLKLTDGNITLFATGFLYINFLLSFSWFYSHFDFFDYFNWSGWPTPAAWAYIICMLLLGYAIYKFFWQFYPEANLERVKTNYNDLLLKGDYAFLAERIERLHYKDILDYLKVKRSIMISDDTPLYSREQQYDSEYEKVVNTSRLKYAAMVYHSIILNEAFIECIAPVNPVFFARIIGCLTNNEVKQEVFVNHYLKLLTKTKNGNFFREIRQNQNLTVLETYRLSEDRPILYALFDDINVALSNEVWQGVGEGAILEMEEEAKKHISPLRLIDNEVHNDTLWSYRMQNAIHYFDIMVREAIAKGITHHMWMYYYEHFVDAIIENMQNPGGTNDETNRSSRNFKMLEEIFMNMMYWKKVALKSNQSHLIKAIYDVVGRCMYSLGSTDKLNDENKRYLMNWMWEDLIDTWHEERDDITERIIARGFEAFRMPSGLMNSTQYRAQRDRYIHSLRYLWGRRDTPKLQGLMGERADKFESEVINTI